jgi:hypothetical protein
LYYKQGGRVQFLSRVLVLIVFASGVLPGQKAPRVVENSDRPLVPKERIRLIPDATIGGMGGDGEPMLASIAGLVVTPAGEIVVLDAKSSSVKVFARDGRLIRKFGRAGKGPGELMVHMARNAFIGFRAPDTVFVGDILNGRVALYGLDGSVRGSLSLPLTGMSRGLLAPTTGPIYDAYIKVTQGSHPLDTVLSLRSLSRDEQPRDAGWVPGSSGWLTRPIALYYPQPVVRVLPEGGFVGGDGSRYELQVFDKSWAPRMIIRRANVSERIEPGDRLPIFLANVKTKAGGMIGEKEARDMYSKMASTLQFGDAYAAYTDIIVSDNGDIWVQRPATRADIDRAEAPYFDFDHLGSSRWDVFNSEGKYLAEVRFPFSFQLYQVADHAAYGSMIEESGDITVRRFRVEFGGKK